ncbi:MAG: PQQ-binding-like beta-propeller repeat protein [Nitriliruptorales bacterium]
MSDPSDEPRPLHALGDRRLVGEPWGSVTGLLMFRGNPSRTWYGGGPVPSQPDVSWRYPDRPMCTTEVIGHETVTVTPSPAEPSPSPSGSPSGSPAPYETTRPITKQWCGSGWTGQPVVWERPDGVTEVIFGAYDGAIHFLDAATGQATRPPFQTGDIIKGSVTLDPDGFPLLYAGSRDDRLRIIALDREAPTELWALEPHPQRVWNNDWDGNPVVVDGLLLEGGEDSWFYAVELNRGRDADGRVQVEPQVLLRFPGWTDALFGAVGDRNVSIESSVAVYEGRVYFANSGGRVVGLDLTELRRTGEAPVVFDYWVGDDIDATIVVDRDGMLYVAVEYERQLPRAREVGQLVKLDPYREGDARVWGVDVPPLRDDDDGGLWATPALHDGIVYVTTHPGELLAVDTETGEVVYREDIGHHEWSSPVVVDDTLLIGLCETSGLRAYDVRDPRQPRELWTVRAGGCIESTPAVWGGRIHVGSRDGYFYTFTSD